MGIIKNYWKIILLGCLLLLLAVLTNCTTKTRQEVTRQQAVGGWLDPGDQDFAGDAIIHLDGEWEFYWNKLLEPADFAAGRAGPAAALCQVPGFWTNCQDGAASLPAIGYGTYRLQLTLNHPQSLMALKIRDIGTAYKLWINDELLAAAGQVGKDKKSMIPRYHPQVVSFQAAPGTLRIVIQVSNFYYDKPGINHSIILGSSRQLTLIRERQLSFQLFLVGALCLMGIYQLGLFLLNRKYIARLSFGFFCLLMMLRTLVTDERFIFDLFPHLGWQAAFRLELSTIYLGIPLFLIFLYYHFPGEMNKYICRVLVGISLAGEIINLVIPSLYFSFLFNIFQYVLLFSCLYIIFILILTLIRKRDGAVFLVVGFSIFTLFIINDILYSQFIIKTGFLAPFGLLFFILTEFSINISMVRAEEQSRLSQEKLIQVDKLASLGTLVSGIAHEINNPNNAILLTAESLQEKLENIFDSFDDLIDDRDDCLIGDYTFEELASEIPESLQRVVRNSNRIKSIISDLKQYARKDSHFIIEEVNISSLLHSAIRLTENQIGQYTKHFTVNLAENLPVIRGHQQRLEQVIINLIQNSCHALENNQQGLHISAVCTDGGKRVEITVRDEGIGMDKATIKQIFDPFFTTKRERGGSGLGLFVSAKIAEAHGGTLHFSSQPGCGTTACLSLPVHKEEKS